MPSGSRTMPVILGAGAEVDREFAGNVTGLPSVVMAAVVALTHLHGDVLGTADGVFHHGHAVAVGPDGIGHVPQVVNRYDWFHIGVGDGRAGFLIHDLDFQDTVEIAAGLQG